MQRWLVVAIGLGLIAGLVQAQNPPAAKVQAANSRVTHVTVYQTSALVTREVDVPEGIGPQELVVSPLPAQTLNSSLYSEGTDGMRVLTTRFRTRATKEDTREEVRKLEAQLKDLQLAAQKLQAEIKTGEQNMQLLAKLEGFTAATMQHLADKGMLNGETTIALAKYVMDTRNERSREQVGAQQQLQANQEQTQFTQRQLQELAAHSNKTEHDAVIIVHKSHQAGGKVKLHYLVDSASWNPQYKLRAGKDKEPIQLEYLAAVRQQTGEDWSNVDLTLSTAQPMLNAAPPTLAMLEVSVVPFAKGGPGTQAGGAPAQAAQPAQQLEAQSRDYRAKAQREFNRRNDDTANSLTNFAAANEQWMHLLDSQDDKNGRSVATDIEGPSVNYHLAAKLSLPSRQDEQVVEVAKLEVAPDYFYKAVPVLTKHVYRLANMTNKSQYVLLPGEATMYIGTDFVGRTTMPLVAIGEQFTVGFGVDPQLQVQRQMVTRTRANQGANQVRKYEYRILVSSYKPEPVKLQVWDRLPHAETEVVGVNLLTAQPEVSKDPLYLREEQPKNLLRWDVTLDPTMNGEKALTIKYEFKMEMDKQMQISGFTTK